MQASLPGCVASTSELSSEELKKKQLILIKCNCAVAVFVRNPSLPKVIMIFPDVFWEPVYFVPCEGGSAFILLHTSYPTAPALLVGQLPFAPACMPLSKSTYHRCKDLIPNPHCAVGLPLSVPHK